jgi:hypothetical protein
MLFTFYITRWFIATTAICPKIDECSPYIHPILRPILILSSHPYLYLTSGCCIVEVFRPEFARKYFVWKEGHCCRTKQFKM